MSDKVQVDRVRHEERKNEILVALDIEAAIARVRKGAVQDYNNGGIGYCRGYFSVPRSSRRVLEGMSKLQLNQLMGSISRTTEVTVVMGMMPRWFIAGEYLVIVKLSRSSLSFRP